MEELRGTISQVFFYNEENGYTIALMETEEQQITVVGELPYARPGASYLLKGEFRSHPKYGEEFSFSHAEEALPTSLTGIREFLSSGTIKGVGPKTAAAIVEKFGEKTLEVMGSDPDELRKVDGIGQKKAVQIAESFKVHREFADVALEFSEFGITSNQALRLYKSYGKDAVKLVKENPYRLIDEVSGIGFRKADKIAEAMGIGRDDPMRIESGIKAFLSQTAGDGNTYYPEDEFIEKLAGFLDVTRESVRESLAVLVFDGSIMTDKLDGVEVVYLYPYYVAEKKVVMNISRIMAGEPTALEHDLAGLIRASEAEGDIELAEEQKRALTGAVSSPMSVITGGPGTGKTTIIKTLIDIFEDSGLSCVLAAPTGRAAKRMEQTTGHPASTVHRLLDYYRDDETGEMVFGKNEEDQLEENVIIVDEASMIDLMLMKGLSDAIKPGTRLILVGDSDQLPSVGAGNVLHDVIDSGMVPSFKLDKIFRQAEESMIVMNAHRINSGEYPELNAKGKDFFFMPRDRESEMSDLVVELVTKRLPEYYKDIDPLSGIQVLTPTHKGVIGTEALNIALQSALNPEAQDLAEKKYGKYTFREGDKVMQIKNDYDIEWRSPVSGEEGKGVFNGDIGVIDSIDNEDGIITIVFDDERSAEYDLTMLDEIEPAYAMTVHKSQGNEFPIVVMPVTSFPPMLATRNLLYTAITRAETAVVLVGSIRWLYAMVDNNRIKERYSGLGQRLSDFRGITGD